MSKLKLFDRLFYKGNHYKISEEEAKRRTEAKRQRKNARCQAIINDLDAGKVLIDGEPISENIKELYKSYLEELQASDKLSILIDSHEEDKYIFSSFLKYTQLNVQLVTVLTDKELNSNSYNHIMNQGQIAAYIYHLNEKEKSNDKRI